MISKTATSDTKIVSLVILFAISFFMFYLGSALVTTLLDLEISVLVPIFGGSEWAQLDIGSVIYTMYLYFGPNGMLISFLAVIGYTVPITILAAIIFYVGFNSTFINRLSRWWLSQTKGPIARLLKFLGISSFEGTLILKEQMEIKDYNINSITGLLKTLLAHIGRTILIPASIIAFIWVFLAVEYQGSVPAVVLGYIPFTDIFLYIGMLIIPVIVLLLFFPGVAVLEQTGLRLVRVDFKKKIQVVSNLGEAIFATVGNILGISAVLLLSSSQTFDLLKSIAGLYYWGLDQLLLNIVFVYPLTLLNVLGYLLVLSSLFLPISGLLLLELYPTKVVEAVKQTRVQILNEGIAPFGKVVLKEG
ncbi:MAG: hypothetical protein ACFFDI_28245 [Promethearchaeota archaeon]